MRIAMLQMDVAEGDKERNIRHAFDLLDEAAPRADVLVMPELWTIGYNFHDFKTGLHERETDWWTGCPPLLLSTT